MINIAILIALVYQFRAGLSGVLVSMSAVAGTMFFCAMLVGSVTFPDGGNPLLAFFIVLNLFRNPPAHDFEHSPFSHSFHSQSTIA